jgi:hypothetical protein
MNRQQVTRNHQQSKNETPLVSGILQRYAVSPEMDDVQSKDDHETQALINSAFSQDFSKVPITATQPQQFAGNNPAQKQQPSQKKASPEPDRRENSTGLPDNLKSGIENLSGYSMDDVKVHYNSDQPTKLQANAYAQGTDIHIAPGQEKHLPHEAWHVVQQKQGRVKPTMQMKGKVNVNDDARLENEADVMGAKALAMGKGELKSHLLTQVAQKVGAEGLVQREPLDKGKLNLVGESHGKPTKRRNAETGYGINEGGGQYWQEKSFKYGADDRRGDPDNLIIGYRIDRFKRHIDDLDTNYEISDVKGMLKYCERLVRNLNSDAKFPHQGKKAPMLKSLDYLEKWANALKTSWDHDHSDLNAWKSLVNQKLLFIKPEYEQLNKTYEAITKRNSKRDAIEARHARSNAMWIGAATGGKTGLWMVGQNHVDDIKMLHGQYQEQGQYKELRNKFTEKVKMQSKAEFENEFQNWWTLNEATYPKP